MKIYTRTGDTGSTGLFGGPRVRKDDARIEAYGTVDELNATIGMVRGAGVSAAVDQELAQIQHELFSIGAELATPDPAAHNLRVIGESHIQRLESMIDQHEAQLPTLKNFILPGGSPGAASLHLARAICRRAERRIVSMAAETDVSSGLMIYLNRLSDYLFVLTRLVNQDAGQADVMWCNPAN